MSVLISDTIKQAIESGDPIVALETAVITSGLPRCCWNDSFGKNPCSNHVDTPINIAVAREMNKAVIDAGAVPAWVSVQNGTLVVGTSQEDLEYLAMNEDAVKVSLATIASAMQRGHSAGTTVGSTLLACKLASPRKPIRVFATGGIGGIHQDWTQSLDVSADLTALATTPTCVVASGAKSILDLPATVEALETIGVPVLGLKTPNFPRFIELHTKDDPHIISVQSESEIAAVCDVHWNQLQMPSAVLANIPVPESEGMPQQSVQTHVSDAETAWNTMDKHPSTRTPFVLDYLTVKTNGASLRANIALLIQNATKAASIAIAISSEM